MLPYKVVLFEWLRFMRPLFRQLRPFLSHPKRLVLMGDWNAILDSRIDKGGRGASGQAWCERSLVDFISEHDLVDRLRVDHPGREMWTWTHSGHTVQVFTYLDRVLVRRLTYRRLPILSYVPSGEVDIKTRPAWAGLHLGTKVQQIAAAVPCA